MRLAGLKRIPTPLVAAAVALLSACATLPQWGYIGPDIDRLGLEPWIADFDALKTELHKHPKLTGNAIDSAAFDKVVDEAKAALRAAALAPGKPDLADIAIAGARKALAAVGDGHTRLNASPTLVFPLVLKFFPATTGGKTAAIESQEGWEARLVATDQQHGESLGAIVTKIGGAPIRDAVARIADYLSIESTIRSGSASPLLDHAVRTEIADAFADPWLMRALGFAADDAMTLTIQGDQGVESERIFGLDGRLSPWVSILGSAPGTAYTRSRPGEPWWYGVLLPDRLAKGHGGDILYLRYDDCDMAALPVLGEVLDLLPDKGGAASGPSHLIVDLRRNGGGDSRPGARFAASLKSKKVSETPGGVLVLVGGATFSSAMMNAVDIMKACGAEGALPGRALLVGEPLIEPLRHYGEVRRFALPNSGIVVGRSSRLWNYGAAAGISPARGLIEPSGDGIAYQSYEAYAEGIDAAFERALEIILRH